MGTLFNISGDLVDSDEATQVGGEIRDSDGTSTGPTVSDINCNWAINSDLDDFGFIIATIDPTNPEQTTGKYR
ncbi:hypothetical protein TWF594_009429 [Orbilia oligospora]|nr:hypothetical protein TWF594_009429 [Orbilia oligospora]